MNVPFRIIAGDAPSWTDNPLNSDSGQPINAGTYSLAYSFRGPIAGAKVDVASTQQGSGWQTALTSAQTMAFNPGSTDSTWYWQATATSESYNTVTEIVGSGQIIVRANLSLANTFDGRSQAEQDLAAVRAAISARANNGAVMDYTIGNRSLKREPLTALLALESKLKADVAREKTAQAIANGLGNPNKTFVRFGRTPRTNGSSNQGWNP